MPNPIYRIEVDGSDHATLNDRVVSITVTDQAGTVNDSCTISLDDRDNLIELPPKGAEIRIWLGYESKQGIVNPFEGTKLMGTFKLDEIKWGGPPDVLVLVGHAFDTEDTFKMQRSGQFHRKTVGEIISIIAERNKLEPRVHAEIGDIKLDHVHQRAQSDMALCENVGNKVGAIAKVQDGKLYFAPLGKMSDISDQDILPAEVTARRIDMTTYDYTDQSRSAYQEVVGRYYDKDEGITEYESAEGEARFETSMELSSDLPNKQEAQLAAEARNDKLQKSRRGFDFSTLGNPDIMAETILRVDGQRQGLPAEFIITQAVHEFTDGVGYAVKVSCIVREDQSES